MAWVHEAWWQDDSFNWGSPVPFETVPADPAEYVVLYWTIQSGVFFDSPFISVAGVADEFKTDSLFSNLYFDGVRVVKIYIDNIEIHELYQDGVLIFNNG